jgi:hypothetical protein
LHSHFSQLGATGMSAADTDAVRFRTTDVHYYSLNNPAKQTHLKAAG